MRCLKALLIALFQCQLYVPILSDTPCTPDPPSPMSNLTNLVQDLNLNSTHWNPTFCGDWRWDQASNDICVRVYCDRTSKNPLDPTAVKPILNGAIYSLASKPLDAPFTAQTWSANDPTGRPGFVLRIAEWEKRHGLLSNLEVMRAMVSLERYWSGPPYEQSDFLIYHDGVGIIGGGSGRRPPRLMMNAMNGGLIN
uniref:Uncharacterized protein n=1 Tax=Cladonia uncialis subsp. uncialis TaxID=180999 RepID=A0A1Z1C4J6_CLAUC|nr:hypothetical protein [Cladonia uncialis subsp. uncialis]AUW31321.1 hypothetical protein [Cladonia uncialis subsp. uncialis]